MGIGKFISKPLKYPLIAFYIFARCLLRGPSSRDIRLNLAGVMPPPGSKKIVHGGKVKLLHLRERFGDSWRKFNIGYFVSSGLPFAPAIWIKIYKFFGVKIVWNQNGVAYPALYSPEIIRSINDLYVPMQLSDYVIYQTKFTKSCADEYLGVFSGPSSILINPVDTGHFIPRAIPLPLKPLVLIMLGNHLESEERLLVVTRAIRSLRNKGVITKLIIIGQSDRNFDEEWIEKRGTYLQKDAPALFQSAHIFIHLKYLDPCPTTVEEALSCGLPVIGCQNGGIPELVNEQSGVLIPVVEDFEKLHYPSADEVAGAIEQIRANYSEYSRSARESASRFDKEDWLKKHEEIFQKLCP